MSTDNALDPTAVETPVAAPSTPVAADEPTDGKPSAIESAQAEMAVEAAEQAKKLPDRETTLEEAQAKSKQAVEAQARHLTSLVYLEDLGDCKVGVTLPGLKGKNHVTCIDPGAKYFEGLQLWGSEDARERADGLVAFARGIKDWNLEAVRDVEELGVAEGQPLPKPSKFVKEHKAEWKKWSRDETVRMRGALREKAKDETFVADPGEDAPETALEALLLGEISVPTIERISMGIMYAALQPSAILDGGDEGNSLPPA